MTEQDSDVTLPSSYVGSSGRVTDAAYDLRKEHLVTVTDEGTISLFRRANRQDEWVYIQEWETPKHQPLSKVTLSSYSSHESITRSYACR